jgi:hypothetical protein
MARGELMKKLLASYGHDDQFRAMAMQIRCRCHRLRSKEMSMVTEIATG